MKHIMPEKKQAPRMEPVLNPERLLEIFTRQQRPLRLDALLQATGLPRSHKHELESCLQTLEAAGHVIRMHGGAWALSSLLQAVTGRYTVARSGAGFVTPTATNEHGRKILTQDISIYPEKAAGAWPGDLVRVLLTPGVCKGKHPRGRIIEVLERGQKEMAVRVARLRGTSALCHPTDPRIQITFATDISTLHCPPRKGDLLLVAPEREISTYLWLAKLITTFGDEHQAQVQEALVKLNHQVPSAFPPRALEEAAAFPSAPTAEDLCAREDLRHIPFVTIDGRSARDFDDAVHVSPLPGGGWLLRVGIADVTHYVRPGSALDHEALARGNSWYFPTSVEPMLPEALSNGLCSLNPAVDRLILLAEIPFSAKGAPGVARFAAAVMRSAARLSYGQARKLLEETPSAERDALCATPHGEQILAMLAEAQQLAAVLRAVREARGALDFDLPEPEYSFDCKGCIETICCKERHVVHRMIEEFMLAANEAVARFLAEKGLPFLYRTHPHPEEERLAALFDTLRTTMTEAVPPGKPAANVLQGILRRAQGSAQEYLVGRLLLRTMPQARYQPTNEGHFGLGSPCYCHFTSPIRRYADIVTHRALKQALGIHGYQATAAHKLLRIGDQLNRRERAAMEAEREISRRLACLVLQGHTGETFDGTICALNDFGIFVEFRTMPVEGMIRIQDLGEDYYEYDQIRQELRGIGTGRRFQLGQTLRVTLTDVHLGRLEIRLRIAGKRGRTKYARKLRHHGGKQHAKRRSHAV